MRPTVVHLESGTGNDAAYPSLTPPDPTFPCRTLEPIGPLLSGVVAPSLWSRLERPLGTTLGMLWRVAGPRSQTAPDPWVSLVYGRILLNAHGWELVRSRCHGVRPDPSLVPPAGGPLLRLAELANGLPAPWRRRRLRAAAARESSRADAVLERSPAAAPHDLDLLDLARGPLDERAWTSVLTAWIVDRLLEEGENAAEMRMARALALERRYTRALGERLYARRSIARPLEAAYLTVEERISSVNDPAGPWSLHLDSRIERVRRFREMRVPSVLWSSRRVPLPDVR